MAPGRIDRRVVQRHITALGNAVSRLRRHAGVSAAALRADRDRLWSIERGLQLAAQNALDVASHICSALGQAPTTYRDAIDGLVDAGVLPADFGERFRRVAGFRNVLVHGYLEVDLELVAAVLNEQLTEFDAFARHVESWLAEPGNFGK